MGKFQRGQPRPKNAGRRPGARNRIPATVREAIANAFKHYQGDPKRSLIAWVGQNKTNLRLFYTQIAPRFIPLLEVNLPPKSPDQIDLNDPKAILDIGRRVAYVLAAADDAAKKQNAPEVLALPALAEKVINPISPAPEQQERSFRVLNPSSLLRQPGESDLEHSRRIRVAQLQAEPSNETAEARLAREESEAEESRQFAMIDRECEIQGRGGRFPKNIIGGHGPLTGRWRR